jgi:hypothetical protein
MDDTRSMRIVKGTLGHSPLRKVIRNRKAFAAALLNGLFEHPTGTPWCTREPKETGGMGEIGTVRRLKVRVRSSERFSFQAASPVSLFSRVPHVTRHGRWQGEPL